MVPLGSGIIMIPLAYCRYADGAILGGFAVLVIYILVICNIDNFMRPHLIPKKAKLLPAVITLSTFCGLYYFGILGIVYGPLVAILLTTTLDAFLLRRQVRKAAAQPQT